MEQVDVLADTAAMLDFLDLPWMLVGSYASGTWGYPRMTHDIDIVIAYRERDIPRLVEAFQDRYYIDDRMLLDGVKRKTKVNFVFNETGHYVDLWPLKDSDYDHLSLERRVRTDCQGVQVWVSTPEDTIIAKLRWHKSSGSEMQLRDVFHLFRLQRDLDSGYLTNWARFFGVLRQMGKLRDEALSLDEAPN